MSHRWFFFEGVPCCQICGVVRRADGKNKPCKGETSKITLKQPPTPTGATKGEG